MCAFTRFSSYVLKELVLPLQMWESRHTPFLQAPNFPGGQVCPTRLPRAVDFKILTKLHIFFLIDFAQLLFISKTLQGDHEGRPSVGLAGPGWIQSYLRRGLLDLVLSLPLKWGSLGCQDLKGDEQFTEVTGTISGTQPTAAQNR